MKIETYLVKEEKFIETTKSHVLPILATSSFTFESIEQGIDVFSGKEKGHLYSRYGNPTIDTVAKKIAKLEAFGIKEDAFGILVSSGMAAISTLSLALLNEGDTLLSQSNLYGGTTELFQKYISKIGVKIKLIDFGDNEAISNEIKQDKSIKMIYCESPANPSMACVDLEFIGKLCKEREIISVIDNTFCTPYIQRPLEWGFDYVIHSTTKYLNGHGNSIAGIIIGIKNYDKIWGGVKLLGTNCNSFDAWLVNNGLKTLAIRMEKHASNALEIAKKLAENPKIKKVNYPFLPNFTDYELAKKQMKLGGGMLSFELVGGLESGLAFMNRIKLATLAPTLGDVDTLIVHPATMSHRNIDPKIRAENGISDGLIRMSVGIEDMLDIYADLNQAMH